MSVDSASKSVSPITIPSIGEADSKVREPQVTDDRSEDSNSRK